MKMTRWFAKWMHVRQVFGDLTRRRDTVNDESQVKGREASIYGVGLMKT